MYFDRKFIVKAGILVLISLVSLYGGCTMDKNSQMSEHWSSVTGVILTSMVTERLSRTGTTGRSTKYHPGITYEYETPLGLLRSDRVTYSGPGAKNYRNMAEKVAARYKVGSDVTVYFNTKKPRQSCLEPGRTSDGIVFIILGVLGLLGCVAFSGARALDRYAGMGDFAHVEKKKQQNLDSGTYRGSSKIP